MTGQAMSVRPDLDTRLIFANEIVREAGRIARSRFAELDTLMFDDKGPQDVVSVADLEVEAFLTAKIRQCFPDDAVLGEEKGKTGEGPIVWVIDPIDGTQAFSSGLTSWCVVLAVVVDGITELGLVFDPTADELFTARRGDGALLNGVQIHCRKEAAIQRGMISVGYPKQMVPADILPVLDRLLAAGGMFHRNGSGALSLCYVGAGRLLGYIEARMYSWDCLAGLLIVREAGGRTSGFDHEESLSGSSRVVAAAPEIFEELDVILG